MQVGGGVVGTLIDGANVGAFVVLLGAFVDLGAFKNLILPSLPALQKSLPRSRSENIAE